MSAQAEVAKKVDRLIGWWKPIPHYVLLKQQSNKVKVKK